MFGSQWTAFRITWLLKVFVILAFSIFSIIACSSRGSGKRSFVIADSDKYEATIYRQNCAICHGKEAYGKVMDGKPVPSLRFGEAKKRSKEEIYQQIKHGKLPMPSFENQLTEKEILRMVDFVMYDLQGRERKNEQGKKNKK